MDIGRKKVLIVHLDDVLTVRGDIAQICVKRNLLDRIRTTNISRVAIVYDDDSDKDFHVKVKTIEFFMFAYCRIAVSTHRNGEAMMDEILESLPHNMRRKDVLLSIGERKGIDCINIDDFING
jgi:hypothetical protein